ncbi:hypothetical protein LTR10_012484 [Elasticomyces elasticus]|nr:hypothetical protein LTR10_012484 [Elasticomyces elasticus]KAK4965958.1 hypothetical protein LTR42_011972 [Elasticomyces elasticus]
MATATAKVFGTYELFEVILSWLPCNQLLVVQRVCMTWFTTVTSSQKLQQGLFMKTAGPVLRSSLIRRDVTASNALLAASPEANPLNVLSGPRETFCRWALHEVNPVATVPLFNPMLPFVGHFIDRVATIIIPSSSYQDVPHAPSWMRMLLTQPPVAQITIIDYSNSGEESRWNLGVNGVTLGDLVQHAKSMLPGLTSFRIKFDTLAPMLGNYWRVVPAERVCASTLPGFMRAYRWNDPGESPIGWDAREDCIDHLGGPLDGADDPRRTSDEQGAIYYRRFAGGRAGIGTIGGKPIFGPPRP